MTEAHLRFIMAVIALIFAGTGEALLLVVLADFFRNRKGR